MRSISWDMMSSTCVQSNPLPQTGGVGYDSVHLEAKSPVTPWHLPHPVVKQEPLEHDSSAYGSASDDFHMSSPSGSDQNSRDSNPSSIPYTTTHLNDPAPIPRYYSTPVSNRMQVINSLPYQQHGFNPLTPPSFEPIISPKNNNQPPQETPNKMSMYNQADRDSNATLTPCTTPPTEVTPPKSPKNNMETEESEGHYYEDKSDGDDHLRRLRMAFERNGMLPGSPKELDHSGEEDAKSDYELDEVDEQGLRVPRVNSHGKVKTFKCKQCEFVAVTKLDFWEHSRGHIKAEKLLTCPKCPFVTEYKHHLEYHLRNHFGSKPFKCDKCSYSCVNKSMLNSHLKSHSNVYQYRCADCTYATKYCHSLKLHLRKYKHNPAMVLNPDGTPNPLPIIDVYGTRRGPKQKSQKILDGEPQQNINNNNNNNPTPPGFPQHSIFPHFMLSNSQQTPSLTLPFPYPLLGAFPPALGNPLLFSQIPQEQVSPTPSTERSSPEIEEDSVSSITKVPEPKPEEPQEEDDTAVLDLSKPEITLPITVPEVPVSIPANLSKNRRKGRAFKFERLPSTIRSTAEEDEPENKIPETAQDEMKVMDPIKKADIFNCQYCDITFRDVVMYTMHMGYHGYKDPFTCNMCGEQSNDKVAFFLHIARTPHS